MTDRQNDGAGRPPKTGVLGAGQAAAVGVLEPTHAEIRSRLSDYMDGSLPDSDQTEISRHLDECPDCRAFWRTLVEVIHATGQLPRHQLTPGASQRILQQLASSSAQT
ncbi:MAG: zf-HC2 domain-containing protein [Chloroflexi bacterium]|nr:MAG: zf-HC2 domain-containing protein [Chloroflexota bacterium]